jgi:hypothetical protein
MDRKNVKRRKLTAWLCILFYCCCLSGGVVPAAGQGDKRALVRQATQSYYNLRRLGFSGFQAKVQPNWSVVVKGIESNAEAMRLLNGLKFSMSLSGSGDVKTNHEVAIAAPNPQVEAGFKQIFGGIEQVLTGFFATWNLFMLNSPLPGVDGEYQLQDLANEYVLTYKDGASDVITRMARDFSITELEVSSPQFKSSVKPKFTKSEKGYVLTRYVGHYVPTSGPGNVELNIRIDYLETKGLRLPQKIYADSVYDGEPNQMELILSDYQMLGR